MICEKKIIIKMHIYIMIQYHNYPKVVRRNISLGQMHWQGGFPSLPIEIAVYKLHHRFSRQSHKDQAKAFWNLECLPLASLALSHLRTRSPTWSCFSPATCLSNHLLIRWWWMWNFSFALFLSSFNFKRISIRVWRKLEDQPQEDWASWSDDK